MLNSVADYLYPSFDPFENVDLDYGTDEDPDEVLAALDRRSRCKRYMVGLFPGVNECLLQRGAIREFLLMVPFHDIYEI